MFIKGALERCLIHGNICKVELLKTAQTHPSLNVPSFRIIGLNVLCVCHIDLYSEFIPYCCLHPSPLPSIPHPCFILFSSAECVEVFSITASAALISEGLDMAHDPMSPEEAKGQTKVHFLSSSGVSLDSFQ